MTLQTYPLSPQELVFHRLHERQQGTGIITAAIRLRGPLEQSRLQLALHAMQVRHPALRARIVDKRRWAQFEVPDEPAAIPLAWSTTTDDRAWETVSTRLCDTPFDVRTGPLVRVQVLQHPTDGWSDLLMVMHHAIVDGRSMFSILQDLLRFYDAAGAGTIPETTSLTWPRPTLQSPGSTKSAKGRGRLQDAIRQWRERRRERSAEFGEPTADGLVSTRVLVEAADVQRINQRCRTERTSLYGVLVATLVQTLAEAMHQGDRTFTVRSPISLRPAYATQVGPEHVGCYALSTGFRYPAPGQKSTWDVARSATQQITTYILSPQPLRFLRLVQAALRWNLLDWLPAGRGTTCQVNNLGVLPESPPDSTLKVEALAWVVNSKRVRKEVLLGAIIIGGRLNLTFRSHLHTKPQLDELAQDFTRRLRTLAESS